MSFLKLKFLCSAEKKNSILYGPGSRIRFDIRQFNIGANKEVANESIVNEKFDYGDSANIDYANIKHKIERDTLQYLSNLNDSEWKVAILVSYLNQIINLLVDVAQNDEEKKEYTFSVIISKYESILESKIKEELSQLRQKQYNKIKEYR